MSEHDYCKKQIYGAQKSMCYIPHHLRTETDPISEI
jgi:hypothetical protein